MENNKRHQSQDEISIIQASKVLSKAYAQEGNYMKAWYFLRFFNLENNRYSTGSVKQKVADMQSMFEFERKMNLQKMEQQKNNLIAEQQIAKEKILRNSFLMGAILLLTLLIVLYNRFELKKRANNDLQNLNSVISLEKKRSDALLLNILPQQIATELKEKGFSHAKLIENTTVVFTDFIGFTAMAESMSAQELVHELNVCFSEFDIIMEMNGIEKIKTIGDAYMAASGIPFPQEDSVKKAVHAALEMQAFISKRKLELTKKGVPAFDMRVGVHTGPVFAGIVGLKKFQYDIWGDTVNTASRMESSGNGGSVNISQATFEILKNDLDFSFESRGKILAKGKGEIEMYFVKKNSN